jgi:hypothetical protein
LAQLGYHKTYHKTKTKTEVPFTIKEKSSEMRGLRVSLLGRVLPCCYAALLRWKYAGVVTSHVCRRHRDRHHRAHRPRRAIRRHVTIRRRGCWARSGHRSLELNVRHYNRGLSGRHKRRRWSAA